jgi:uncharacterized protein YkwD
VRTVSPALAWAALAALALAVMAVALRPLADRLSTPTPPAATPLLTGSWLSYVAPEDVCPGGDDPAAPPAAQRRTMSCLVNYARTARGLVPVWPRTLLKTSAALKAEQIVRCRRFDHDPCGTGADGVFHTVRYGSGFAYSAYSENIALSSSEAASPRAILNAWLKSPHHRDNLFRPEWREQGVALLRDVSVGEQTSITVWVSQFGLRRNR